MDEIELKRCFNHENREAVAKCLDCGRFFCRECINEHEGRFICAQCLKKSVKQPISKRHHFLGIYRIIQVMIGIIILWMSFNYLGDMLLSVPSEFHEGTAKHDRYIEFP